MGKRKQASSGLLMRLELWCEEPASCLRSFPFEFLLSYLEKVLT